MIKLPVFYVPLSKFILGRTKFTQQNESTMIFKFYTLIDKQMTQCFASFGMSNIS
jgi:hypothetical protein